jgi:hypothetical protein
MFTRFILDNNNTNITRTNLWDTGHWWLSGEQQQVDTH